MLRQIQAKPLVHRLEAAAWEAAVVEWAAVAEVVGWAAAVAEWAAVEEAEWVAVVEQAVVWAAKKVKALKDR